MSYKVNLFLQKYRKEFRRALTLTRSLFLVFLWVCVLVGVTLSILLGGKLDDLLERFNISLSFSVCVQACALFYACSFVLVSVCLVFVPCVVPSSCVYFLCG